MAMKKENIDTPCTTAEDIKATLLELGSEKQSKIQMRFFKTGKGDYGEGDKFLGVMIPNVRLVVRPGRVPHSRLPPHLPGTSGTRCACVGC